MSPVNKTLYIANEADAEAWSELARYLRFYEPERSLSAFLTKKIKEELARMKVKYDKK